VINELILENMRALGATVVSVTSNLHSARHVADRIVMLHEGRIVWAGNVDELDSSDDPYINQFLHKTPGGPISVGFPAH
ncbi:MAG: ABC transporter ATP-binding protein, partial [Rickettsiales bacterium]